MAVRQTTEDVTLDAIIRTECEVKGYLTTADLATLWDERCRQVDRYRVENPDDLKGIDLRQYQATAILQAYRFLSALEQQLGLRLALPVIGRDQGRTGQ